MLLLLLFENLLRLFAVFLSRCYWTYRGYWCNRPNRSDRCHRAYWCDRGNRSNWCDRSYWAHWCNRCNRTYWRHR